MASSVQDLELGQVKHIAFLIKSKIIFQNDDESVGICQIDLFFEHWLKGISWVSKVLSDNHLTRFEWTIIGKHDWIIWLLRERWGGVLWIICGLVGDWIWSFFLHFDLICEGCFVLPLSSAQHRCQYRKCAKWFDWFQIFADHLLILVWEVVDFGGFVELELLYLHVVMFVDWWSKFFGIRLVIRE